MDSTQGVPHYISASITSDVKTKWNACLLSEIFGGNDNSIMVQMLLRLKKECTLRNAPNDLYQYWPILHGNSKESNDNSNNDGTTTNTNTNGGGPDEGQQPSSQLLIERLSTSVALYQTLSKYKLYWSNTAKTWNALSDGLLPNPQCTPRVIAYAETSFAMLSLPPKADADFKHAGVEIKSLTPEQIRRHLLQENRNQPILKRAQEVARKMALISSSQESSKKSSKESSKESSNEFSTESKDQRNQTDLHSEVALLASELVCFCLSDLSLSDETSMASEIGRGIGGLCLIPTADGGLSCLPRERQRLPLDDVVVLGDTSSRRLLIPSSSLLHPAFLITMKKQLSRIFHPSNSSNDSNNSNDGIRVSTDPSNLTNMQKALLLSLGISTFTPSVLAAHISKMLPPEWKNQLIVQWTPSLSSLDNGNEKQPSLGWMRMFWNEISINNSSDVHLFDAWPLVPLKNMELMSCSLMECGIVEKQTNEQKGNGSLLHQSEMEANKLVEQEKGGDDEVVLRRASSANEEVEAEISF